MNSDWEALADPTVHNAADCGICTSGTIVHFADCSSCLGNITVDCSPCKHRAETEGTFPHFRTVSAYPSDEISKQPTEGELRAIQAGESAVWFGVGIALIVCLVTLTAVVLRESVKPA